MQLGEKRNLGKWWLCAGCSGLLITSAFIATTLYLGSKEIGQPHVRPRFRYIHNYHTTEKPSEISTLSSGPDPNYEDLYPVKNTVRKKSHVVYPHWKEDISRPIVVDPNNFKENFQLPGIRPTIPPFQYIKEYSNENPMYTFLQKRLKDVYELIENRKSIDSDWLDVLDSVNESVYNQDASIVMTKLKNIYYNISDPDTSISSLIYPSKESLFSNSSSLVSFGLLAIDLFLLHNVQQIAFTEDHNIGQRLKRDPEVVALNALFLPPDQIRNSIHRSKGEQDLEQGILQEVIDFLQNVMRGITNLGKAYKKSTSISRGRSNEPSPLDCIWTLYCRNLDKTAKIHGPYGFLAKMNSLGLRLMMGEFPVEQALEKLFTEFTRGWGHLNCHKLFPRCSADEARHVVMETALGDNRI